jgi:hypothetical protein
LKEVKVHQGLYCKKKKKEEEEVKKTKEKEKNSINSKAEHNKDKNDLTCSNNCCL